MAEIAEPLRRSTRMGNDLAPSGGEIRSSDESLAAVLHLIADDLGVRDE